MQIAVTACGGKFRYRIPNLHKYRCFRIRCNSFCCSLLWTRMTVVVLKRIRHQRQDLQKVAYHIFVMIVKSLEVCRNIHAETKHKAQSLIKGKWQQKFLSSYLKGTPKQYIEVYNRIFISALFGEIF